MFFGALTSVVVWLAVSGGETRAQVAAAPVDCVGCHTERTPGIVEQWAAGAMGKSGMTCSACHGTDHRDATDYAKARMPTPDTCQPCHARQVEQFRAGKHALAWAAMEAMPMITHEPAPIVGPEGFKGCSGCHKIGEKSAEELGSGGWRYGTGSCDSCHTRHTFSKAEARDPRACQTCHMGFDHPQWEMWSTSKHGTIWQIENGSGRAPGCQTCHMPDGDHGVMTAWGFLAVRVPEDDADWMKDRMVILQALGVLDEKGEGTERLEAVKAAKVARLTKEDFDASRAKMVSTCERCHATDFVKQQLGAGDTIVREADRTMAEAILVVKGLYNDGVLEKPAGWTYAPDLLQFFEARSAVEQELYVMFMEYRMRAFQGAFHMNPDYMNWYGWAAMKEALQRIKDEAATLRREKTAQEAPAAAPPPAPVPAPAAPEKATAPAPERSDTLGYAALAAAVVALLLGGLALGRRRRS
ncbi:MAG: cytochrome C [Deltaproteobacteria bacterium]|nr:cytochrome C [Deltaproteobacteria bacterium]